MVSTLNLYLDDSGTRHPDKAGPSGMFGDWFGLGGVLVADDEEARARALVADFNAKWGIDYPLHSVDIRGRAKEFSWLGQLSPESYNRFMSELTGMLQDLPCLGMACAIDRPGYYHRYHVTYGPQKWNLCRTAFSVVVERAAKHARSLDRQLRVYVEETDVKADNAIRDYYKELRVKGLPFDTGSSAKYTPLSQPELHNTLYELKLKKKSSPMIQVADLYLYPLCRGGYQSTYYPYRKLREANRVVDDVLTEDEAAVRGVKYSCFEHVSAA